MWCLHPILHSPQRNNSIPLQANRGGGGLILEGGEDMEKEKAAVDLELIPAYVRPYLLSAVVDAVTEYFAQPGVQGRYERWLEAKKAADKSEN